VYRRPDSRFFWVRYRNREGEILKEATGTTDWEEANRFLRDRLDARDEGRLPAALAGKHLTFNEWADWFLEHRSRPPYRTPKTHRENLNVLKSLRPAFGALRLSEIRGEAIEHYLEQRLGSGRRIHTKFGLEYRGKLKPATVHQEFRVLRRILNLAVKQKRLSTNPCQEVEFPVPLAASTRKPHYMTATEQARIEFAAPGYLRNVIVLMVEMGFRQFKELLPLRKPQVDLENRVVHILDSKTPEGIADLPMTELARKAFLAQMAETPGSEYLFPSPSKKAKKPYLSNLRKAWERTLEKAGVPYFTLYELRHTFATRLSAGGVADEWVTQLLRQGDAKVFKKYSQMRLEMRREALEKLNRQANEPAAGSFGTVRPS
jgi:integrase